MANDTMMKFQYTGVQMADEERDMKVIVSIDQVTYHELKYLLSFAAEKHEYYSHIEDAVHMRDSLIECWQTAREQNENNEDD